MLRTEKLNVAIEGTTVLRDVTLEVATGAMVGLIGRNGAGKTTLMRSIMGLLPPHGGSIALDDTDLLATPPYRRASHGIGYMPEDRRLVPELSVADNIMIPAWATGIRQPEERLDWIYSLMPEVAKFRAQLGMALSGGQQKLVALARALVVGDRVLLLDEPFEGVAPALAMRLVEIISALKSRGGISVLISESDHTHTRSVVDNAFIIERGHVSPAP